MQHTFFVHFFAVVLHDYNVTLSETSWLQLVSRFMEEVSYELSLFTFFFFHWRSFSPCTWGPLAFLIFSPPLQNFHVFLSNEMNVSFVSSSPSTSPPPPVSLSRSLPLPLSPSLSLSLFRPHPVGSFS